jgi:hypothetical protein
MRIFGTLLFCFCKGSSQGNFQKDKEVIEWETCMLE